MTRENILYCIEGCYHPLYNYTRHCVEISQLSVLAATERLVCQNPDADTMQSLQENNTNHAH